MAVSLAATEAEEIAKALNSIGIRKLSGKGVDPAITKALKQKNTSLSNSTIDATKEIQTFFENIEEVQSYLSTVKSSASGDKYGKLSTITDLYSYITIALTIESEADNQIKSEIVGFDARTASAAQIASKIDILSRKHAVGVGFMSSMRQLDSSAKTRVFISENTKAFYDNYIQQASLLQNVSILKKLPEQLLVSNQVSEKILTALQTSMHITRAETVWCFNHLLGLSGANQYIDMENENVYLTCASCGTVNRLCSKELSALYGKRKFPVCNTCQESLLSQCPVCKKWMPKGARKHICGWDVELTKMKKDFETAITNRNVSVALRYLASIEVQNPSDKNLDEMRTKAKELEADYKKRISAIRKYLNDAQLTEAEREMTQLQAIYPDSDDFSQLESAFEEIKQNCKKIEIKDEIQRLIDANLFNDALEKVKEAELAGLGDGLDELRLNIRQKIRITLINAYSIKIEKLLFDDNLEEASECINEAEINGFGDALYKYRKDIDEKREELKRSQKQALIDFGDGHFGNYANGIKKITRILDLCPSCQQARIWLKDNPRKDKVTKPSLSFKQGECKCTVTWEDDDSSVLYSVRRADNRFPRDPEDGVGVCSLIPNTRITDTLPIDLPGVMWQYSIFAIRNLDGQWVKTDCPGEASWLPNPEKPDIEIDKDSRNRPIVRINWKRPANGCAGLKVVRYSDDDDFSLAETLVDVGEKWDNIQADCLLVDSDIDHGTTYRYTFRQVWKKGSTKYMSSGISVELEMK